MTWYKIHFLYDMAHHHRARELVMEFNQLWLDLGVPAGFNLFELTEQPSNEFTYYVPVPDSPNMLLQKFLRKYAATPCDKPDGSNLLAVRGSAKDYELWFGPRDSE